MEFTMFNTLNREDFDFWMRDKRLIPIVKKYLNNIELSPEEFQLFKRYICWWVKYLAIGIPFEFYSVMETLEQDDLGSCFCFLLQHGVDPL